MAIRQVMVSDITGAEGAEGDFVTLVVRSHPAVEEPKAFDALPSELEGLKGAADLVVLEVGENGDKRQVVVTVADFRKLVSDEKVKKARATRGRRPGFSPKRDT